VNYLILDIVTTAAILFVISSGLMIIFGVMKIINFAHASFLATGGYAALIATQFGWDPWFSLPLAFLAGFILGGVVERLFVRYLYGRPLDAILATWGLNIIIVQLITILFGRDVHFVHRLVHGPIEIIGASYSLYRLVLIIIAVLLAGAMWFLLQRTRLGLQTRAVIMNESLARGIGIRSARVRIITFAFGSALACLAGAFVASLSSVYPNMGFSWLIGAFMIVLISGHSLLGLVAACIVLGCAQVVVSTYVSPVLGIVTLAVLAALLLRIRPSGFARA
jgi:branched-chain amino acid transport system permease protein